MKSVARLSNCSTKPLTGTIDVRDTLELARLIETGPSATALAVVVMVVEVVVVVVVVVVPVS